jgi:hypothetical protein
MLTGGLQEAQIAPPILTSADSHHSMSWRASVVAAPPRRVHDMDGDEPMGRWGPAQWGRAPACLDYPLPGDLPRPGKSGGSLFASQRPKEGWPEPCPTGLLRSRLAFVHMYVAHSRAPLRGPGHPGLFTSRRTSWLELLRGNLARLQKRRTGRVRSAGRNTAANCSHQTTFGSNEATFA